MGRAPNRGAEPTSQTVDVRLEVLCCCVHQREKKIQNAGGHHCPCPLRKHCFSSLFLSLMGKPRHLSSDKRRTSPKLELCSQKAKRCDCESFLGCADVFLILSGYLASAERKSHLHKTLQRNSPVESSRGLQTAPVKSSKQGPIICLFQPG